MQIRRLRLLRPELLLSRLTYLCEWILLRRIFRCREVLFWGGGVLLLGLGCENSGIAQIRPYMGDYDESRVRFCHG